VSDAEEGILPRGEMPKFYTGSIKKSSKFKTPAGAVFSEGSPSSKKKGYVPAKHTFVEFYK
jgi:hypothetical protein